MTSQLKGLLTSIADGARVYDVIDRAERRGRRRRRLRQAMSAVASVVVLVAAGTALVVGLGGVPGTAPQPGATLTDPPPPTVRPPVVTQCTIERLPLPPDEPLNAEVSGGDPTGRFILGHSSWMWGPHRVWLWDDGELVMVDMPGFRPVLTDINSSGLAVGMSLDEDGYPEGAWFYLDGQLTALGGPGTSVQAVNESGVAVGRIGDLPVRWRWPSTEPEYLAVTAEHPNGNVRLVEADGTVLGSLHSADWTATRYVRWEPDGTLVAAPEVRWARDVTNIHGWTGSISEKDAFINGRGIGHLVLPRLPDYDYEAYGTVLSPVELISDDGRTVAGYVVLGTDSGYERIPVVWHCA